jgi:hypothetical protein
MSGWESGSLRRPKKAKGMKTGSKKRSIAKLKKDTWAEFSKMIRLKYADHNGYATCVTCGAVNHWKELQAGHFTDGRRNATLFDERNVHCQCVKCNMYMSGNKIKYYGYMLKHYGQDVIDELQMLDKQEVKFYAEVLLDMKEKYKMRQNEYAGCHENTNF